MPAPLYGLPVSESTSRNQTRRGRGGGQDAEDCSWSEDNIEWVVGMVCCVALFADLLYDEA